MPLLRRRCPKCGTKVSWVRLWLKAWISARWPCPGCAAMLKFHVGRRLLVAALIMLVLILAFVAGTALRSLGGTLAGWVIAAAAFLLLIPVLLLDAVTLA